MSRSGRRGRLGPTGERRRRRHPGRRRVADECGWSDTPPPRNWITATHAGVLLGFSRGGLRWHIGKGRIRTLVYAGVRYCHPGDIRAGEEGRWHRSGNLN